MDHDLHSNMVRFIIFLMRCQRFLSSLIYIPIWLDLLSRSALIDKDTFVDLHSNMVRFIISS